MSTRLQTYLMRNGVTALGEEYFNKVWTDIDSRLDTLEKLQVDWEYQASKLEELGLSRIDLAIRPAIDQVNTLLVDAATAAVNLTDDVRNNELQPKIDQIEALLSAAQEQYDTVAAQLVVIAEDFAQTELSPRLTQAASQLSEIDLLITATTNELNQTINDANSRLTSVQEQQQQSATELAELQNEIVTRVTYANRDQLRDIEGNTRTLAVVEGLGMFLYHSGIHAQDDDETCFKTAGGAWLITTPSFDFVTRWLSTELGALQPITQTVENPLVNVAANSQAAFSAKVPGARPGAAVIATPPAGLDIALNHHALVTAKDTITVYVANSAASPTNLPTGSWLIHILGA